MRIERLSTQLFLSFAAFSGCMLMFIGLFSWMSYQAGMEAAAQKLLVAEVERWRSNPDLPLPEGPVLIGVTGVENLPPALRGNLDRFEAEDYDVPLWEWREIQMWRGPHPQTGEEVFFFLKLGETADRDVFTPNLQRGILLGGALVLLTAVPLGYVISRRLSRPLRLLTHQISILSPGTAPRLLAADFPRGETRDVARAFDGLLSRLQRFVERERRFTRDASHELRTPLTLMRTATRVLRNSLHEPTAKQLRALTHLDLGVDEMTRSVESFLYLARERELHAGKGDPSPATVLKSVVRLQLDQLERSAEKIRLTCIGEPDLQAPADMFRIVAGNLIRNALLHGGDGAVEVRLSTTELCVQDQGDGIPQAVLDQMGKPFPTGSNPAGTGLGLSIVQDIAARTGWTFSLHRRAGGGTCARVHFPDGSGIRTAAPDL